MLFKTIQRYRQDAVIADYFRCSFHAVSVCMRPASGQGFFVREGFMIDSGYNYEDCCVPKNSVLSSVLSRFADNGYTVFPGFCDVHVHFREPGFSYKETIRTGSMAAARGGYTAVCTMPNLNPVPDCRESLLLQQKIISEDSAVHVYPYAAITVGQKGEVLSPMEDLTSAIAFSDDGRGVQSAEMMRSA